MGQSGRQKLQTAKQDRRRKRRVQPEAQVSTAGQIAEKDQPRKKHPGHKAALEKTDSAGHSNGGRHMAFILGFSQLIVTVVLTAIAISALFYFLTEKNWKGVIWSLFAVWCVVGLIGALYAIEHYIPQTTLAEPIRALENPPSSSPTPTPPKLQHPAFREKADTLNVDFGGVGFGFARHVLEQGPGVPLRISGFVPVTLHLVDNNLYADTEVYAGPSKAAIKIKANEFEVTPLGWDKNSSENAFEVVNERQMPVFQMIYESPSRIVIKGYLILPNGRLLFASETGLSFDLLPKKPLDRIFKYPAWKYPGIYE